MIVVVTMITFVVIVIIVIVSVVIMTVVMVIMLIDNGYDVITSGGKGVVMIMTSYGGGEV
jgi:hypothetical protein